MHAGHAQVAFSAVALSADADADAAVAVTVTVTTSSALSAALTAHFCFRRAFQCWLLSGSVVSSLLLRKQFAKARLLFRKVNKDQQSNSREFANKPIQNISVCRFVYSTSKL